MSTIGVYFVKTKPGLPSLKPNYGELEDPLEIIKRGFYVALFLAIIGLYFICFNFLNPPQFPDAYMCFFFCACIGVAVAFIFVLIT